jgi:hypothetical protein
MPGNAHESPSMDVKILTEDEYQKHLFAEIPILESRGDSIDQIQHEWSVLNAHAVEHFKPKGSEGWDYNLMDWPKEIPLYNISLNSRALKTAVTWNNISAWLADTNLDWRVRVELYDSIQGGTMTLGACLGEMLVARNTASCWGAFADDAYV